MRKHIFSTLALLFVAQLGLANVVTGVAAIPDGYYDGVNNKTTANSILDALFDIIKNHTVISYTTLFRSRITKKLISIQTQFGICILLVALQWPKPTNRSLQSAMVGIKNTPSRSRGSMKGLR